MIITIIIIHNIYDSVMCMSLWCMCLFMCVLYIRLYEFVYVVLYVYMLVIQFINVHYTCTLYNVQNTKFKTSTASFVLDLSQ